jgi:microtubule-associated protein-like 5
MAICNLNGDLIATGELSAIKPAIHVWNCRTLQNIQVISGVHQKGIHLLQFSSDDRFLLTCGLQNPSAVLIYDWYYAVVIISASI